MHNQFKELGKNGEKHGYILEVYLTHDQAENLDLFAKGLKTTPALIAHNMISNMLNYEITMMKILELNSEEE